MIKPVNLNEIKIILHYTRLTEIEIISNKYESKLSATEISNIESAINQYRKGLPLDYIFNKIKFLDQEFIISFDTLIPREETEEWVQGLKTKFQKQEQIYQTQTLVDLATGSGVIGISLTKFFKQVYLSDISPKALEITKQNVSISLHNTPNQNSKQKLIILESNLLQNYPKNLEIDVLTANLPYLPSSDKANAISNNISYEPPIALYSGQDGLDLFKELISQIQQKQQAKHNQSNHQSIKEIYLELDPRNIKNAIVIAQTKLPEYNWEIWTDYNKFERVLVGIC